MFQPTGGSATALHSSPLLLNMSAAAAAAAAAADKSSTTGAAPVNHQSLMGVTSSSSSAKVSVCAYILHVVVFLNVCSNYRSLLLAIFIESHSFFAFVVHVMHHYSVTKFEWS